MVDSLKLSRKTMQIIRQNLFWAFIYNLIGIPIAAGLLVLFGGPAFSGVRRCGNGILLGVGRFQLASPDPLQSK